MTKSFGLPPSGAEPWNHDRRRNPRFDETVVSTRVWMVTADEAGFHMQECGVRNISYTGACLKSRNHLSLGERHRLLVYLGPPFNDVVLVSACVRWTREVAPSHFVAGFEFLQSSKGWLGPDTSDPLPAP